jgi:hypothetical protein
MRRLLITIAVFTLGMNLAPALVSAQTIYPKGTTVRERGTYDGYTLFIGGDNIVYLIDMDGTIHNTWVSPDPGEVFNSIEALPNGHIMGFSNAGGFGSLKTKIIEVDFFGNEVWRYELPPGFPAVDFDFHHDNERLPNGNTLILASQTVTIPTISPFPLMDDVIIEVDPDGNIVWSWQTYEHFHEFGFSQEGLELIYQSGGDWAHANSINAIPPNNHVLPALAEGNIIVSQRNTNCVFIIDKATGAIVWKRGPDDHVTYGQHDPHMIKQGLVGAGNILVFDNGSGTGTPLRKTPAPGYSRVHEIDPTAPPTNEFAWTYRHQDSGLSNFLFFANVVSGAQRLPNGNTLICSGARGRLFEITPNKDIVWEWMSPFVGLAGAAESLIIFRAYRLDYDWAPTHLISQVMHRPPQPLTNP